MDGDEEEVDVESCDMTNVQNGGVGKKNSQVVEKILAIEKCVSDVRGGMERLENQLLPVSLNRVGGKLS